MFVVESDKHHVYWHVNSLVVVTHELHSALFIDHGAQLLTIT